MWIDSLTRRIIRLVTVGVLMLVGTVARAQADPITWKWDFTVEAGDLLGARVFGLVTYDDGASPSPLHGGVPVSDLSLNVGSRVFDLTHSLEPVVFFDPRLFSTGFGILNYQVRPAALFGNLTELSLRPGGNLFFIYRTGLPPDRFTYIHQAELTRVANIPEPGSLVLVGSAAIAAFLGLGHRALRSVLGSCTRQSPLAIRRR